MEPTEERYGEIFLGRYRRPFAVYLVEINLK
jgi:hypothetical protein